MCFRQNDRENNGMSENGPSSFNPASSTYKACCCHVRSFTIVSGIIEIFIICFGLVAVIPDLNTKFCEGFIETNSTINSTTISNDSTLLEDFIRIGKFPEFNGLMTQVSDRLCGMSIPFLIWSLVQIVSVILMFFGIKGLYWPLFLPHIAFRILCVFISCCVVILLITLAFEAPDQSLTTNCSIGAALTVIFALITIYCVYIEFYCVRFVRRSRETGISLTATQAVHPPTMSFDGTQGFQNLGNGGGQTDLGTRRVLPPLRGSHSHRREPHYAASNPHTIEERKEEDSQ